MSNPHELSPQDYVTNVLIPALKRGLSGEKLENYRKELATIDLKDRRLSELAEDFFELSPWIQKIDLLGQELLTLSMSGVSQNEKKLLEARQIEIATFLLKFDPNSDAAADIKKEMVTEIRGIRSEITQIDVLAYQERIAEATETTAESYRYSLLKKYEEGGIKMVLDDFEQKAHFSVRKLEGVFAVSGNFTNDAWTTAIMDSGIHVYIAAATDVQEYLAVTGNTEEETQLNVQINALSAKVRQLALAHKVPLNRRPYLVKIEGSDKAGIYNEAKDSFFHQRSIEHSTTFKQFLDTIDTLTKKLEQPSFSALDPYPTGKSGTNAIQYLENLIKNIEDKELPGFYQVTGSFAETAKSQRRARHVEQKLDHARQLILELQRSNDESVDVDPGYQEWKSAVASHPAFAELRRLTREMSAVHWTALDPDTAKARKSELLAARDAAKKASTKADFPRYVTRLKDTELDEKRQELGVGFFEKKEEYHLQQAYWEPVDKVFSLVKQNGWPEHLKLIEGVTDQVNELVANPKEMRKKRTEELKELKERILKIRRRAADSGLIGTVVRPSEDTEEQRELREDLEDRLTYAQQALDAEILERELDLDPEEMSLDAITDYLLNNGIDLFQWGDWKHQPPSKYKDLVQAFKSRIFSPIVDFSNSENIEKEMNRIYNKVRYQLVTLDNELMHETGKASSNRGQLYAEMARRTMGRKELLLATTQNPVWGQDITNMLQFAIQHGALRPGDRVNSTALGPIEYIYELSYEQLAGESGRDHLGRQLALHFPHADEKARDLAALLFTSFDMLSISLRERQKSTQTPGHNTEVEDNTDHIGLQDAFARLVHNMQRYGGAMPWETWMSVYFDLEDIPEGVRLGAELTLEARQRLAIERGVDLSEVEYNTWEQVVDRQQMLIEYLECLYPTQKFAEKIKLPGFCEAFFPDEFNMATLHPSETLRVENELRDWKGRALLRYEVERRMIAGHESLVTHVFNPQGAEVAEIVSGKVYWIRNGEIDLNSTLTPEKARIQVTLEDGTTRTVALVEGVTNLDLFKVAESGWKDIIELTYGALPHKLTREAILEEAEVGKKGGWLNRWLSAAGRVKMFPGNPLDRALVPMLTHFCFRLLHNYEKDGSLERISLWQEILKALRKTADGGGLQSADLSPLVYQVMENLMRGPDDDVGGAYAAANAPEAVKPFKYTMRTVEERITFLTHWWHEEIDHHNLPPILDPNSHYYWNDATGTAQKQNEIRFKLGKMTDPRELEVYSWLSEPANSHLPHPATRKGSLAKEKEH